MFDEIEEVTAELSDMHERLEQLGDITYNARELLCELIEELKTIVD